MWHTSVLLRCPDELYTWFEERLTAGTVEQAMLAALSDWQQMQTSAQATEAQRRVVITTRLGSIFGEILSPLPSSPAPAPPVAHLLPVMPQGREAKRRHQGGRRRNRR